MKRILTILCAGVIVLASACKKDRNTTPDLFVGAIVKNQSWKGAPNATYITTDTLQIIGYKAAGEQTLLFNLKFKGLGTYTLTGLQAQYFTTVGGDVFSSLYQLDNTKTNTVTVDSYAVGTGVVSGRFELNFVKTQGGASADQTLSFTNGRFWAVAPAKP